MQISPDHAGFSLVEVLVACTLLALVIVPIIRSLSVNQRVAYSITESSVRSIQQASDAALRSFENSPPSSNQH